MPTKTPSTHRSVKHEIINKDSTRIVTIVAGTVFLVVFCGFAFKTLFSQSLYHNRVIGEKEKALRQLESNKEAVEELEQSYTAFVGEAENILSGSPGGDGPLDGDNAKIVLDALPGIYDYPALSSSFEKILLGGGYTISSLGGTEEQGVGGEATSDVKPINIPYAFSFVSTVEGSKDLLKTLERSIRPMNVDSIAIQVQAGGQLETEVTLHTYFTQQKTFELGSKEVE